MMRLEELRMAKELIARAPTKGIEAGAVFRVQLALEAEIKAAEAKEKEDAQKKAEGEQA